MNSLRSRLVLAFALVALVPLAIAMALMATRIQETVRVEAADRLNATLANVSARIRADGETLGGRLQVMARERALARLGAASQPADTALTRDLTVRAYLLGLDALEWLGPGGLVVAAAHAAPPDSVFAGAAGPPGETDVIGRARPASPVSGVAIEPAGDTGALLLVARAPVRAGGAVAGVLRGAVRMDAAWLARQKGAGDVDLALRGPDGRTAASTLGADREAFLPLLEDPEGAGLTRTGALVRHVPLEPAGGAVLIGIASTAAADAEVRTLWVTSGVLGLLGLAVAMLLGLMWSRRIARPIESLAAFSARVAQGEWDRPLEVARYAELETLAHALERMREDLTRYRARLVASERQAAWSQMARMVAHEVKNPLTPIAVSIADLQRSYRQQRPDFPEILDEAARTIAEEVESLKRLLQEFSEFGRMSEPELQPVRLADVAGDLGALYHTEIDAQRLSISGPGADVQVLADRAQLRQAMVNLVKNALEATAHGGRVQIEFEALPRETVIVVADSGPGVDPEARAHLFVPEHTTKPGGSGLGLTIVERIVTAHGGTIAVASEPGHGTRFEIRLPRRGEET